MVKSGDGEVEFQMLGAKQHATLDGQTVVDDDAFVIGQGRASLLDPAREQVQIDQPPFQPDQHDTRFGGFREEARPTWQGDAQIRARLQVQNIHAADPQPVAVLDGHPSQAGLARKIPENMRTLRQITQFLAGGSEELFGCECLHVPILP